MLMQKAVYLGRLRIWGEEHRDTLLAANNYTATLVVLRRFEEAKALLRKTMPVARRVLGMMTRPRSGRGVFTRCRSARTPPPRSTIFVRQCRCSRTLIGSGGACSAARTHSQRQSSANCKLREPRSAPAKRRRGVRKSYLSTRTTLPHAVEVTPHDDWNLSLTQRGGIYLLPASTARRTGRPSCRCPSRPRAPSPAVSRTLSSS